jgi:hypothetical protein
MSDFQTFLKWEERSRDTIDFKKAYVDMAGDVVAGLMLSQIVFWYLPSQNGGGKLRVERDGHRWLVKTRDEWWDECRLSPREVDRARKLLETHGIIEVTLYKFNGSPTQHIRIHEERFLELWKAAVEGTSVRSKRKFTRGGGSGEGGAQVVKAKASEEKSLNDNQLKSPNSPNSEIHFSKQVNGFHQIGKMDFTDQGIPRTEITSEITTETTAAAEPEPPECQAHVAAAELVSALISNGVSRAVAIRYASEKPDLCRRYLEYLPYADIRTSKGAWLANAIRDEYGPPPGYERAREEQEREQRAKELTVIKNARQSHEVSIRKEKEAKLRQTFHEVEDARGEAYTAFNQYVEEERGRAARIVGQLSAQGREKYLRAFDEPNQRFELFKGWVEKFGEPSGAQLSNLPENGQNSVCRDGHETGSQSNIKTGKETCFPAQVSEKASFQPNEKMLPAHPNQTSTAPPS